MLDVDATEKTFDIPCAARPVQVRVDPDGVFPGRIR